MASLLPQPVGFMRMRSRLYLSLFRCSQCCLRIVYSVFRRTACVLTWVCRLFVQFDSCRACDFVHKDFRFFERFTNEKERSFQTAAVILFIQYTLTNKSYSIHPLAKRRCQTLSMDFRNSDCTAGKNPHHCQTLNCIFCVICDSVAYLHFTR